MRYFHRYRAGADPRDLLEPENQVSTPWGEPDHGRCEKCDIRGEVPHECLSCLELGADPGCPACRGRVRFIAACPACEGGGTVDHTRRSGVSVFPSEAGLYRYLAERDDELDEAVVVEMEARLSDERDLDADRGALLVHPTRIVAVAALDRERVARLRAGD